MNNLPPAFISHIQNLLGKKEAEKFIESLTSTPPVAIRINPDKNFVPEESLEKIPWSDYGYYLPVRPVFTFDPVFHAGGYYVQEPSSMFLEQAVKNVISPGTKLKVLDISAAPGGKSTHLLSLLNDESLLVSNEVIRSRAKILKENIIKWGKPNVIVSSSDPEKFSLLNNFFDLIIVDAPCSGEGLFRKDVGAVKEWSEANVNLCSLRQKRILNNIWKALKPGGYLIYSTCTFQSSENENQIKNFINDNDAEPIKLNLNNNWKIEITETATTKGTLISYRFYPHMVKGEGFFLTVIKKPGDDNEINLKPGKKVAEIAKSNFSDYITDDNKLFFFDFNKNIFAFPNVWKNELNYLSDKINIVYAGVVTGKMAGKEFIPAHALALSNLISSNIPYINVNNDEAIQYLKKSEIKIKTTLRGWALIKFKNMNLGWVKVLPNRINNYYPKEYRIRM